MPTATIVSPLLQEVGRPGCGQHLGLAHDRDDGASGPGAGLRITQWAADERRVGAQRDLLDGEPRHLLPQAGELGEDQRPAEHLRQRGRLVVRQRDRLARPVGVVLVGEGELTAAVAEVEDGQPAPLVGHDVMTDADAGQFGALDVGWHASIMAPEAARRRPRAQRRAARACCAAVA